VPFSVSQLFDCLLSWQFDSYKFSRSHIWPDLHLQIWPNVALDLGKANPIPYNPSCELPENLFNLFAITGMHSDHSHTDTGSITEAESSHCRHIEQEGQEDDETLGLSLHISNTGLIYI